MIRIKDYPQQVNPQVNPQIFNQPPAEYWQPYINTIPYTTKSHINLDLDNIEISDFEKILDELFSVEEKVEFLVSMGYFVKEDNLWCYKYDGNEAQKKLQLMSYAFLREMSIKFKNLLLSKNVLKLKI